MRKGSNLTLAGLTIFFFASEPVLAFVRQLQHRNDGPAFLRILLLTRKNDHHVILTRSIPSKRGHPVCLQSLDSDSSSTASFADLFQFELLSSISAVSEEAWDRCLSPMSSPFMEHSWLRCLEEGGCATVEEGWMPSHVQIRMGDRICGFVPVRKTIC